MYAGYSYDAGSSISNSTLIGYSAGMSLSGGSNNTLVGFQAGDTLSKIASRYGISVETVMWANDMSA